MSSRGSPYPTGEYLPEIIKLQLRKPKNWNWELSTSKSSPHIAFPIIQLYNSKGRLLVEARDAGLQRNTWHSSDAQNAQINRNKYVESESRVLQRCRSDTFDMHRKQLVRKFESINRMSSSKSGRDNSISCSGGLSEKSFKENSTRAVAFSRSRTSGNSCENVIRTEDMSKRGLNYLRKSKSDVLQSKFT